MYVFNEIDYVDQFVRLILRVFEMFHCHSFHIFHFGVAFPKSVNPTDMRIWKSG